MKIYIGSDHRGYELKERIKKWLESEGYEVEDCGAFSYDPEDDYPDFAVAVAERVRKNPNSRGILLCGSGHGVDIVANRFAEIRSILGFNVDVVKQGREHEDANILSLPADWVGKGAIEMVNLFLQTDFSGSAKRVRRLAKMRTISKA